MSWHAAAAAGGLCLLTLSQSEFSSNGRTYNGVRLLLALAALGCVALYACLRIGEDLTLPRWKAVLMRTAVLAGGGAVVVAYLMYQPPRNTAGDYSLANPFVLFAAVMLALAATGGLVSAAFAARRGPAFGPERPAA